MRRFMDAWADHEPAHAFTLRPFAVARAGAGELDPVRD
jgi:hypothetical protein